MHGDDKQFVGAKGMAMKTAVAKMDAAQEILERTAAELAQVLRFRDGIAIEKSADQMDEVQYASERELATRTTPDPSQCRRAAAYSTWLRSPDLLCRCDVIVR